MTDLLDNDLFSDDEIKIREQLKLHSSLLKKKSNAVLKKVKELEALVEKVRALSDELEALKWMMATRDQ
jgi:hypothetical protein